jgi:hypothetical protein
VRDRNAHPALELVERHMPPGPNRCGPLTSAICLYAGGFLYLVVVLDAFSRRILGWPMETHLRTELVLEALNMALAQRRPAEVIHHSDQGTQYTWIAFAMRCQEAGVRPRWARSVITSTMPCARAFSPRWNASCSTPAASTPKPRPAWRSSSSSRTGTTPSPPLRLDYLSPINYERSHDLEESTASPPPSTQPG